jgi:hypothetical protein
MQLWPALILQVCKLKLISNALFPNVCVIKFYYMHIM